MATIFDLYLSQLLQAFKEKSKIYSSVFLGTFVEYYEYALYVFLTPVFVLHFFPEESKTIATIKLYAIFFSGFLAKILGAAIFGALGDRAGRAITLKYSIAGLSCSTILIGMLPGYLTLGKCAALLLLGARFLQGIFIAGESDGTRIYLYESIGKKWPCVANSLASFTCLLGIYVASLVADWVKSSEDIHLWRIAFIVGGLLGGVVYWLRHSLPENDCFSKLGDKKDIIPKVGFLQHFWCHKKAILIISLLCGSVGGGYHFYLIFFPNFLSNELFFFSRAESLKLTSTLILIYTLCLLVAGILGDYVGALRVLKWSLLSLIFMACLNILCLYYLIMPKEVLYFTAVALAFPCATGYVVLINRLSVPVRFRTLSLGHAIGTVLFSGSAPLISLSLWEQTNSSLLPMVYFFALMSFGCISVFFLQRDNLTTA